MPSGFTVFRTASGGSITEAPRTVTVTADVPAGSDVFVLALSSGVGTFTSVTSIPANTYVRDGQGSNVSRGGLFRSFAIANAYVNASSTLTLATSGSSFKGIAGVYFTGGTIGALDKSASTNNQSTATPVTGTTGALANASEIAIAIYDFEGSPTFTEPAGWTNFFGAGAYMSTTSTVCNVAWVWQETTTTTALNPQATLGSSQTCAGAVQTYTWAPPSTGANNVTFNPVPFMSPGRI